LHAHLVANPVSIGLLGYKEQRLHAIERLHGNNALSSKSYKLVADESSQSKAFISHPSPLRNERALLP